MKQAKSDAKKRRQRHFDGPKRFHNSRISAGATPHDADYGTPVHHDGGSNIGEGSTWRHGHGGCE